jgi:formylglycine-generating enzyme required for sulfatase activity
MGWSAMAVIVMTGWTVYLSPVGAAPQAKELDPVPMVTIPAGEFLMGNPEGVGRADEWPQRPVYLDAFRIDQVEVTNERYMAFVRATGHRNPPNPYGTGPLVSIKGIEQLPVVQTTWYDAKAFCSWAKKRLPTDERTLSPVGSLPGGDSPYGVKDMAGNAREWVSDWYDADYYRYAPDRNPAGPDKKGVVRSIRGGSWHSPVSDITTSARGRGGFALQTHGMGFRCARGDDDEGKEKSCAASQ